MGRDKRFLDVDGEKLLARMYRTALMVSPDVRVLVLEHPKLGAAWDLVREAEEAGPLAEKMRRIVKLAPGPCNSDTRGDRR